jgi:hypothetical protein
MYWSDSGLQPRSEKIHMNLIHVGTLVVVVGLYQARAWRADEKP